MTAFLDRCLGHGIAVLIGDVGRAWLPHSRLDLIAHYPVADVGDGPGTPPRLAGVYRFTPAPAETSHAGSDAISRR